MMAVEQVFVGFGPIQTGNFVHETVGNEHSRSEKMSRILDLNELTLNQCPFLGAFHLPPVLSAVKD